MVAKKRSFTIVRVASAGAVAPYVFDLAKKFSQDSGHPVETIFGTAGKTRERLENQEADVVVMPSDSVREALTSGLVKPGSSVVVGYTGMGVCVRSGSPKPDISSVDAFKRTLLAAKSVASRTPPLEVPEEPMWRNCWRTSASPNP